MDKSPVELQEDIVTDCLARQGLQFFLIKLSVTVVCVKLVLQVTMTTGFLKTLKKTVVY